MTPVTTAAAGQIAVGMVLAALAVFWLLPRPRGRSVALGTFAGLAAAVVLATWLVNQFGDPTSDAVGTALFWLFGTGAVLFGAVFVVQKNPARGALAFAFVVLSVCGLFLLLAAPFLAAATIIIYAGAVIVTFLFVLMLSQTDGPSGENDRSREPLLGTLGGFALLGLILFTLDNTRHTDKPATGPVADVSADDRAVLLAAADDLGRAMNAETPEAFRTVLGQMATGASDTQNKILGVVGPSAAGRTDPKSAIIARQKEKVRDQTRKAFAVIENLRMTKPNPTLRELGQARRPLEPLRHELILLAGFGELPARNVANLGYSLYADHLLAVELAGTLLLVATIGAVSIAGRKGAPA